MFESLHTFNGSKKEFFDWLESFEMTGIQNRRDIYGEALENQEVVYGIGY